MITIRPGGASAASDVFGLSRQNFELLLLCVFAALLIFIGLGARSPWPADEPRFALIAEEMWHSGQWLFPMRGGELYPDKPPVFMWSIAALYGLTGSIKIAFLLPSALCSMVTMLAVYDLGRRFWSHTIGLWAAGSLLVTLQFVIQAKTAQIDAMVCCWITLACYGLLRHLLSGPSWFWYGFAGFFMGLGIITKGVGFLPILMLIPYVVLRMYAPQSSEIRAGWQWGLAPLWMLLVVLAWVGPILLTVDAQSDPAFQAYRDNLLFKQTATRYVHSLGHVKPFWFYIVSVIPFLWLPLSVLLPGLVPFWWRALKDGNRHIVIPLIWCVLVIVFFSISPGKRGVYILPALPMLALVAAPYLERLLARVSFSRALFVLLSLIAAGFIVFGVLGLIGIKATLKLEAIYEISPWWLFCAIGFGGLVGAYYAKRTGSIVGGWTMFVSALWLLYSTWGYSVLGPARTPERVYQTAETYLPKDATVGLVDFREQFLLFSPYHNVHFGFHTAAPIQEQSAWVWLQKHPRAFLIAPRGALEHCFAETQAVDLGAAHRADWLLFGVSTMRPACERSETVLSPFVAPDIPLPR